jgi:hypothetical protein
MLSGDFCFKSLRARLLCRGQYHRDPLQSLGRGTLHLREPAHEVHYIGQYSQMDDFGLMFYNARWYDRYITHAEPFLWFDF